MTIFLIIVAVVMVATAIYLENKREAKAEREMIRVLDEAHASQEQLRIQLARGILNDHIAKRASERAGFPGA